MKVSIDREGCTECGACVGACADIFELSIVAEHQAGSRARGNIPEGLLDCARNGADACQVEVIHLS